MFQICFGNERRKLVEFFFHLMKELGCNIAQEHPFLIAEKDRDGMTAFVATFAAKILYWGLVFFFFLYLVVEDALSGVSIFFFVNRT